MTFEQLEDLFFKLRVKADPSGFHGFLCGRLCCGKIPLDQLIETSTGWLGLSEEQADGAAYPLRDFYEASLTSLEDVAFLFQPVLPDDELPLPERLVAVGQWCSNYLSGVGDGMTDGFAVSDDVKEALEDISAIAQVSVDFETDDDGERDYSELIEYIRIAVQLIFSELHPEAAGNSGPTVH
jgi:hypothetical protein|tara:strand:+ start:9800 stop:10345 length:546 start_codon:yes stop_codon:yes gene_type:complete